MQRMCRGAKDWSNGEREDSEPMSLALWIAVAACGRSIGFFEVYFLMGVDGSADRNRSLLASNPRSSMNRFIEASALRFAASQCFAPCLSARFLALVRRHIMVARIRIQ